jgi:hypothetical protein
MKHTTKIAALGGAVCGLLAVLVLPAWAQDNCLTLTLRKLMGLNAGSRIQGSFKAIALGPENLTDVTFTIDGQAMGEVTAPPFELKFNTDDYAAGWHALSATGRTADGQTLQAPVLRFEFVTAAEGWKIVQRIVIPIAGLVLAVMVIGFALTFLMARGKTPPESALQNYGVLGGAICPKCGRPFARHWWSPNLGLSTKLERCPYCGRWSLARRAGQEALEAAAAAARVKPPSAPAHSAEEELQRRLKESKYTDL